MASLSSYNTAQKIFIGDPAATPAQYELTDADLNTAKADAIAQAVGTVATSATVGTVKPGSGLAVDGAGVLSITGIALASISAGAQFNGRVPVVTNGSLAYVSLPAGSVYTSTAPVNLSGNAFGLNVGTGLTTVGGALTVSFGTTAGTAAAGNDSRLNGALQPASIPASSALLGGSGAEGQAVSIGVGSGLALAGGVLTATSAPPAPRIITSSADFTVGATDVLVVLNRTVAAAATTVTLPPSPPSWAITIKDMVGNAASFPITIVPAAGTLDGGTSFIMNKALKEAVTFWYNGAEWSVV